LFPGASQAVQGRLDHLLQADDRQRPPPTGRSLMKRFSPAPLPRRNKLECLKRANNFFCQ